MSYLRLEGGASFDGEGYIVKEDNHLTVGHILIEDIPADDTSHFVICDRSGFKAKPGELRPTWDGLLVLDEFSEPKHPQDRLRKVSPERQRGAIRPEDVNNPNFISSEVLADDL